MNELGEKIKQARKQKGLKCKDLAEMLGISREYFSRIETGKKRPSLKLLKKICETLDLDYNQMFKIEKYLDNNKCSEWEKKIKEARMWKGLNSKDAARVVGISISYWSEVEKCQIRPSLKILSKICEVLELDFNEMLIIGEYRLDSISSVTQE